MWFTFQIGATVSKYDARISSSDNYHWCRSNSVVFNLKRVSKEEFSKYVQSDDVKHLGTRVNSQVNARR